ncbi:hypothetical protein GOBAR_AA02443 [Gossypium barbadense]|uniref:Uncharacterized protein n=1 Tax=Gossypium barbadense TaxID=3634 RepID=A0A2P5YRB9_GOSBA|nr:hypothetical protein GOBAR_AA02443 [Gossypium barbadense]
MVVARWWRGAKEKSTRVACELGCVRAKATMTCAQGSSNKARNDTRLVPRCARKQVPEMMATGRCCWWLCSRQLPMKVHWGYDTKCLGGWMLLRMMVEEVNGKVVFKV